MKQEFIGGLEVRRECVTHRVSALYHFHEWVALTETWYREAKLHREDGPAKISPDPATGAVMKEEWYREGKMHRDDGPAAIARDAATGVVILELWVSEDRMHREGGPAPIKYDAATGAVINEAWWLDGERQEPPQS
jgi:hypothetical protein